jgi:hypothetical protein
VANNCPASAISRSPTSIASDRAAASARGRRRTAPLSADAVASAEGREQGPRPDRPPRRTRGRPQWCGPSSGAEFLAAIGHDLADFSGPDGLAAFAGLAPAPHDSGKRNGDVHRPRHYHRGLQRIFYMSALMSVRHDLNSRTFHDLKRSEGKRRTQAVIALARSVNVLSALIRDRRPYQVAPPQPTG